MQKLHILKLLSDLGAPTGKPGAAKGPDALLHYDELQNGLFTGCSMSTVQMPDIDRQAEKNQYPNARFCNHISDFQKLAAMAVSTVLQNGDFPLVLSGDHSSAAAVLAGLRRFYPNEKIGVIWVDAHADLHTPFTTPSGNMHGMPVALGFGEDNRDNSRNKPELELPFWNQLKGNGGISPKIGPSDFCYVELRDMEKEEEDYIIKHGIKNYTPDFRKTHGLDTIIGEVCNWAKAFNRVYVTFDIDSMDEKYVPGTGTPVPGGFAPAEACKVLESLWKLPNLVLFEVTEINPDRDPSGITLESVYRALTFLNENIE